MLWRPQRIVRQHEWTNDITLIVRYFKTKSRYPLPWMSEEMFSLLFQLAVWVKDYINLCLWEDNSQKVQRLRSLLEDAAIVLMATGTVANSQNGRAVHTWPTDSAPLCWEALFVFCVCLQPTVPGCSPHHNNSVWSQSPERSLLSSCLVNRTSCLDGGRGRAFICFQRRLKRSRSSEGDQGKLALWKGLITTRNC